METSNHITTLEFKILCPPSFEFSIPNLELNWEFVCVYWDLKGFKLPAFHGCNYDLYPDDVAVRMLDMCVFPSLNLVL